MLGFQATDPFISRRGEIPGYPPLFPSRSITTVQSIDAAKVLMGSKIGRFVKHVIVVDEDVNPFCLEDVYHAINTRFQAGRDLIVTRNESGSFLDPSVSSGQKGLTDKMILDATWSMTPEYTPSEDWGGATHPPMVSVGKELRERVDKRWETYGIGKKR